MLRGWRWVGGGGGGRVGTGGERATLSDYTIMQKFYSKNQMRLGIIYSYKVITQTVYRFFIAPSKGYRYNSYYQCCFKLYTLTIIS